MYFPLQEYTIILILSISSLRGQEIVDFGKTYTGVAFSPYVKDWVQNKDDGKYSRAPYNNYSLLEVVIMLENISTRFNSIATYGMGVEWYNLNNTWDNTDSTCLIPKAAAKLNRKNGNLTFTIMQGIHPKSERHVLEWEIENAFAAAAHANSVYPKTVWALAFLNQAVTVQSGAELIRMLVANKARAETMGLKVGPRLQNCAGINSPGPIQQVLQEIANVSDFIMCNQHPNSFGARQGPDKCADIVFQIFQEYSSKFKSVNPNIEIILGETGWASKGRSFNGPEQKTSVENMVIYWKKISELSNRNQVRSYLFEAFDEPWKADYAVHDPNQPQGRFGVEKNFGWWRRVRDHDIYSNVEKITEPPEPEEESPGNPSIPNGNTGMIIGIVIGCLLLVFLPIILFLIYRLRKAKVVIQRLTELEIQQFEEGIPDDMAEDGVHEDALLLPYNRDYEIPKDKLLIERNRILGKGEFGMVYRGKIEGKDEDVAFKTVRSQDSVNHLRSLLSELKIMIYIGKHENVIGLLGAYTAEIRDGIVYIAAEFCANGCLEKYLRSFSQSTDNQVSAQYSNIQGNVYTNTNESVGTIPIPQLIRWSYQIACGMEWLANKKVIHADLATRNVLLTVNKTAKITDFGLSRRLYEYTNYVKESQEPLPWRWMAIESLRSMHFSSQSDVWSYAVTLYEIFSMGDVPYPGLSWHIEFVQSLEKGLRLTCPKYANEEIYDKLLECWRPEPNQRPRFLDLVGYFESML